MKINVATGLIEKAKFISSPNCAERPPNTGIELLVIHGISLPPDEFGGPYIEALFTNTLDHSAHPYFQTIAGLRVSSHILIRRDGSLIQFVPFIKAAWHAGVSSFQGRERCNEYSIGIELEGTDTYPYTSEQYKQLAELTQVLMQTYPAITRDRIVGHSDIAPGRKTDPGPVFDWQYYFKLLSEK
jgi:N-acetyl-anhydromuramoyl-L-alanine amidase